MVAITATVTTCDECGQEIPVHVYKPLTQVLRELVEAGRVNVEDLPDGISWEEVLAEARETDRQDEAEGEIKWLANFAAHVGAIFVDSREEQIIYCPRCSALVYLVCKRREG